jgi:hypothetical protein
MPSSSNKKKKGDLDGLSDRDREFITKMILGLGKSLGGLSDMGVGGRKVKDKSANGRKDRSIIDAIPGYRPTCHCSSCSHKLK